MNTLTNIAGVIILVFTLLGVWQVVWIRHRSRTEAQFIVFAARLRRDTKGRQTAHILNSLKNHLGIVAGGVPTDVAPDADIPSVGISGSTPMQAPVAIKARSWLWQQFAHVLIWGEVNAEGNALHLRLTAAHGAGGTNRMPLGREVELPVNFGPDYGTMLAALTAMIIPPAGGEAARQQKALLANIVRHLQPLAERPPAHFSSASNLQLWHVYADAECRLDADEPDTSRLKSAITYYYRVLESWPHEYAPFDWAATQAHLGDALLRIGERETDTGPLGEAVAAYRHALQVLTRAQASNEWALAQNNLGLALWRIGEREGDTARLEEAVTAFREALRERTLTRSLSLWAQTQNNLGNALSVLGERESSMAQLLAAIAIFREVLQAATRDSAPLDWAMTQHNLGIALTRLGAREASADRLKEAVAAFQQALHERTEAYTATDWAATQNSMGTTLAALGELAGSTPPIEQAVAAYKYALRVYAKRREQMPLEWAGTQNNLGSALALLGEREKGTSRLEEAVNCFRAALQEYTRARTPLQWTAQQLGLGATFPSLGEDETRAREPSKPQPVLKQWARERVPLDRAATQNNLGAALLTLGERQARSDRTVARRTLTAAREVALGALEVRQLAAPPQAVGETRRHLAEIDHVIARLGIK